ncbi:pilus assembly protein CpaE [Oceanobacillus piezotolerans]|uniref:Pilus assembly protein CpaE n=1 Tax=Oceanobacillus piezotolerans TaxID=2448030 RepID=A0A498D817_9BACI|nr:AAA family ATPase [Oceanobacillus piezotolerans]RLL46513.1 pilus assembly protein CpaE [Oceanobacillus piezotolerans]
MTNDGIEILLVCEDEQVKNQLSKQSFADEIDLYTVSHNQAIKEMVKTLPDILLIVDSEDFPSMEFIQQIQSELNSSYSPVILYISYKENFIMLRDLIRIGVNDYFVLPDEIITLNERLIRMKRVLQEQKISKNEAVATTQALKKGGGQIYSFFSGKGGVGCSLLSTLYSQTMKFESTAEVLFIDLNLQYGGGDTYLGIESERSIADLIPVMNELNEQHIHNVVVKEPHSGLDLLLSPQDGEIAESIHEDHVIKLLRTCRRAYDFIIIDLPSHIDPVTFAALGESDLINYVMTLDTPSLRIYKNVNDLFQKLRLETKGRLQLVINGIEKNNELNPSDLKEFINSPVVAKIKVDKKGIYPLINKGEPIRKGAKEKKMPLVAKNVRKWVLSELK